MMNLLMRIFNKLMISLFENRRVNTSQKAIFLTFDDGPEPEITEFVLDELGKYGFKVTFFCRGDNAEKHPQLLEEIKTQGHAVANHSYSHIHSFDMSGKEFAEDVHKCDSVLETNLLRPPHGSLKLSAWLRLRKDYKIYFWSLNSGDSDMERYDYNRSINTLMTKTKPGDIVLFHFCHKHEKETRELLPEYLKWLAENHYSSQSL